MAELRPLSFLAAELKAEYLAKELSKFLSVFNETYPDDEAVTVQEHFDIDIEAYIAQACGSILANHFVLQRELEEPMRFDLDVDELLAAIRPSMVREQGEIKFLDPLREAPYRKLERE